MFANMVLKTLSGLGMVMVTTLAGADVSVAENVLYAFHGGTDGVAPSAGLIADGSGNLYGTTQRGGDGTGCNNGSSGCGTVFELSPASSETILYTFQGGTDGGFPAGALRFDGSGNFYGTTGVGGSGAGCGTVFKLTNNGVETPLYSFQCGADGGIPTGNLATDKKGNLYGTTQVGGAQCFDNGGCGVVFKVAPDGTETVLHAFLGGNDGWQPGGGVIRDSNGNLYGTAGGGVGGPDCPNGSLGCGVVFEIAANGAETILHSFAGGSDGNGPAAGLLRDSGGNLYGTTIAGGAAPACPFGTGGCGTVFKIAPDGTESILYAFKGGSDGAVPFAGVIMDKSGNLYGTTYNGGGTGCKQTGHIGCGTVFKLAPDGTETILVKFGGKRGQFPTAPVLLKKGELYGTTSQGGTYKDGVVFSVKP